jgi:hypothetical protein
VKHVSPRTNLRKALTSKNTAKAPQKDSDRLGAATVGRSKKNPLTCERSFLFLTLVLFLCLTKENINNNNNNTSGQ